MFTETENDEMTGIGLVLFIYCSCSHEVALLLLMVIDPSAAADRRIRRRKFVRRKSAGKITARRISRRILLALNPP